MFVGCSSCARHVRDTDATCPFCGTQMPRIEVRHDITSPRLSRAALILAGAAAISACGKTTDTGSTASSSGPFDRGPAPAYGGPPPSFLDATTTVTPVPPPDAAATSGDAGRASDAGAGPTRDR